jgi:hypothetical protein
MTPMESNIPATNANSIEPYFLYGVIRPERAQISISFALSYESPTFGTADVHVSIVLNQLSMWITRRGEGPVSIWDLRNFAQSVIQDELGLAAYSLGYLYDVEITRIINRSKQIDYVYGIDVPAVSQRHTMEEAIARMEKIRPRAFGPHGILIRRSLSDLASAMRHPMDTAFYCYRALEALRLHCSQTRGLGDAKKNEQWSMFRDVSGVAIDELKVITRSAEGVRHGAVEPITDEERADLFTRTWRIVDRYLDNIQ